jgi:hypothetical protein
MENGSRLNQGKKRWSLVDFKALEPMVQVLEFGAKKYDDHNWKKGLSYNEMCESAMRHLTAFMAGEDVDPESGELHIGHLLCNAMFISWMQQNRTDKDDRFTGFASPETNPFQQKQEVIKPFCEVYVKNPREKNDQYKGSTGVLIPTTHLPGDLTWLSQTPNDDPDPAV